MENSVNTLWIATLGASLACYILKVTGFLVPESWLNRPRIQRINELVPVVLLSALVAVQTFAKDGQIQPDHRIAGVLAAAIALKMRLSFPLMMIMAAVTSAFIYRLTSG